MISKGMQTEVTILTYPLLRTLTKLWSSSPPCRFSLTCLTFTLPSYLLPMDIAQLARVVARYYVAPTNKGSDPNSHTHISLYPSHHWVVKLTSPNFHHRCQKSQKVRKAIQYLLLEVSGSKYLSKSYRIGIENSCFQFLNVWNQNLKHKFRFRF
ncbi:hypothetical protein Pint_05344 [Pistacia integerrima]|uniref:Uncharacterized protein n=1 Tax=Pistacia integerrima TaxID=434235 RepID=A0ACC0Z318_9ROSI|nr:hypothetical protein Pint_05344 [Pistacia integerrima]